MIKYRAIFVFLFLFSSVIAVTDEHSGTIKANIYIYIHHFSFFCRSVTFHKLIPPHLLVDSPKYTRLPIQKASNGPITCDISFLDNTKWEVNISILKSDNQTKLPRLRFLVVWSEITLDEKLNSCSKRRAFNLILLPSSLSSDHDSVIICWSLEWWSREWVCNDFIGRVLACNLQVVKVHFTQSWVNLEILLRVVK